MNVQFFFSIKVVHPDPCVPHASTCDKLAGTGMKCHRCNFVLGVNTFNQLPWRCSAEKICRASSRNRKARVGEVVELASADGAIEIVSGCYCAGAKIPPTDFVVVRSGDNDVGVGSPDNRFDVARVNPWADFVAFREPIIACAIRRDRGGVIAVDTR